MDTPFDAAGRLASVVNNGAGGGTWELRGFDGTDRVVSSVRYSAAPTVTEDRLWDSVAQGVPQVVASSRDGGATWSDVTFGPGGLIASAYAAGATTWFQTDPRGSVIELPSNPGVVDGPARYEATGAPATAPPDPIGATVSGYRGEQTAAGLVHLRAATTTPRPASS